jgi:hypothetical protein
MFSTKILCNIMYSSSLLPPFLFNLMCAFVKIAQPWLHEMANRDRSHHAEWPYNGKTCMQANTDPYKHTPTQIDSPTKSFMHTHTHHPHAHSYTRNAYRTQIDAGHYKEERFGHFFDIVAYGSAHQGSMTDDS